MSKYIIELDENAKKVVAISLEDGIMWTDETEVNDLEELNSDYINEHFGQLQDEAYQKGLEDGKGAIHKGCEGCRYEAEWSECCKLCSNNYSNLWQKQDDEIKVGDEVEWDGDRFVVTRIFKPYDKAEECDGVGKSGCTYNDVIISVLTKTGRHFDIDKILEEMKA